MGQITEDFARTMLEQCARKEHPSLTVWEAEQLARAWLRLAEEVENAATYKQERDEICVNYETVAAKLSEAHRQNADLMAIIDKRDEALGFIPLDKGMDMMDELREAKARLAEADKANQLLRADLAAAAREEDLILTALRLDPERYRTECGYLNVPKIIAAIKHPDEYPRLTDSASAQEDIGQ